jgi:hypothetical protein
MTREAKTPRSWSQLRTRQDLWTRSQGPEGAVGQRKAQGGLRGRSDYHLETLSQEGVHKLVRAAPSRFDETKCDSNSIRSINGKTYAPVNLDRIAHWIEQGRLTSSPESPITARELVSSGCIHNAHDGVKLLGDVRHLPCLPSGSFLDATLASPGCATSQSTDTHHAFSRVQVCHRSRRESGRHSSL